MKHAYKGWRIEVNSYSSGQKWRPIVIVSNATDGRREITNLKTPSDWLFNTKQESDEQGHHLGSTWIDRRGLAWSRGGVVISAGRPEEKEGN